MRNNDSVFIFKCKLYADVKAIPRYFYAGNRRAQGQHTRLGTTCSSLNDDLFQKRINDSSLCLCGNVENTDYYFLHCRFYRAQTVELIRKISQHTTATLQILLSGNPLLSLPINTLIFEAVHTYINYWHEAFLILVIKVYSVIFFIMPFLKHVSNSSLQSAHLTLSRSLSLCLFLSLSLSLSLSLKTFKLPLVLL